MKKTTNVKETRPRQLRELSVDSLEKIRGGDTSHPGGGGGGPVAGTEVDGNGGGPIPQAKALLPIC
jgi:hypothetical protein